MEEEEEQQQMITNFNEESSDLESPLINASSERRIGTFLSKLKPLIDEYQEQLYNDLLIIPEVKNDLVLQKLIHEYQQNEDVCNNLFDDQVKFISEYEESVFNSIITDMVEYRSINNQFELCLLKNKFQPTDLHDFTWISNYHVKIKDSSEPDDSIIDRWFIKWDKGNLIKSFIGDQKSKGYDMNISLSKPHRSETAFLVIQCKFRDDEEEEDHTYKSIIDKEKDKNDIRPMNGNTYSNFSVHSGLSKGGRPRKEIAGFRWYIRKGTHSLYQCIECNCIVDSRYVKIHKHSIFT